MATIEGPWAFDALGNAPPTWYEIDGLTLVQLVEAGDAPRPIVFDPTYSAWWCGYWSTTQSAVVYLEMFSTVSDQGDQGWCSALGVFEARNGYRPVWAHTENIFNNYGKYL